MIVTENGLGSEDDGERVTFIQRALASLLRGLDDGLDVRGYMYWSAMDNFEWMMGYRPKFGLVAVDRATQERRV
jgi:beta-glucosidase